MWKVPHGVVSPVGVLFHIAETVPPSAAGRCTGSTAGTAEGPMLDSGALVAAFRAFPHYTLRGAPLVILEQNQWLQSSTPNREVTSGWSGRVAWGEEQVRASRKC